ncbi:MAG: hypothetical protein M3Z30_01325 [Gemmatimonadota bacterium]|nr:hypothetical protein [Gemmatimonadota bacterium]
MTIEAENGYTLKSTFHCSHLAKSRRSASRADFDPLRIVRPVRSEHSTTPIRIHCMDAVILLTDQHLPLSRHRLEDDPDLAPGAAIVGTYLGDALITRAIAEADWEPDDDMGLLDAPRQLHYTATEIEGGTIRAELGALIPAPDVPREPWEPEPDEESLPLIFPLGIVVRIAADRTGAALDLECFVHFQAILSGSAEPVADRILRRL